MVDEQKGRLKEETVAANAILGLQNENLNRSARMFVLASCSLELY